MQPIGSIVYLKNGHRKLMITNRVPIVNLGDGEVYFDYAACLYPIGFSPEQVYYFNEENIDKVIFKGYSDEDEERFVELFHKWLSEEGSQLTKGNVEEVL